MVDSPFNHKYMDFVNRIGALADIAYKHVHTLSRYCEVKQDRYDAIADAVCDACDMAYTDGSDYFVKNAIKHAQHMFDTYKQTDNYHDAEYYKYYLRCMKKYHSVYSLCMMH